MPPAARPSVSEKIRLIASPRPIASSTMTHRTVLEVEHDLLSQADDVADPHHHRTPDHQVENTLVHPLRIETAEIGESLARQPEAHGLECHELGAETGQHGMVRFEAGGDQLGDLTGALRAIVPAVGKHDALHPGLCLLPGRSPAALR